MPPKRNSPAAAPTCSPRKTRSMAAGKRGAEAPSKMAKEAAVEQKGKKRAKKEEAAPMEEEVVAPPSAEQKGRKKAKKEEEEKAPAAAAKQKGRKKAKEAAVEDDADAVAHDGKRVVVEACTQCQHFKRRALKVKEDLESIVPGVSVVINPEKPRRGCLEIREEGGEVFISLLNMPRPFTAMKKLDMDEVIQEIAKKIT